jgi:hypothetical protein
MKRVNSSSKAIYETDLERMTLSIQIDVTKLYTAVGANRLDLTVKIHWRGDFEYLSCTFMSFAKYIQ